MIQVTKIWWDGDKLMDEPIDPAATYKEPEHPAQQEPVAWTLTEELEKRETKTRAHLWFSDPVNCMWTPLYTSPQPAQRTWVGLTDEEKSDIWCVVTNRDFVTEDTHVYADAIEAKLKEKNT